MMKIEGQSTIDRISKAAALQPTADQEIAGIMKWQFIVMNIQKQQYTN